MARANRDFSDSPTPIPKVHGFNPGGDDFGVVRMIDGHDPTGLGSNEGSNVHVPSSNADPEWHDDFSQYDPE